MNNHHLDNMATKRYESAQNEAVTQFSELFLPSVTKANAGSYQCIVTNSYGVAYSNVSQLSVFGELFSYYEKQTSPDSCQRFSPRDAEI